MHMYKHVTSSALPALGVLGFLVLASPPGLAANYQASILQDNPLGYWRLSEAAPAVQYYGTNLGSLGPSGLGEYLNRPTLGGTGALTASTDTAAVFSGTDYLRVPYSAEVNPGAPFTVEFWARPASLLTADNVVSPVASLNRAAPAAQGWVFYQSSTGWNYRQGNSTDNYTVNLTGTNVVQSNVWYHVAATFDGTTATLYVNGAPEATVSGSPGFDPNPSAALGIGARGDGAFGFSGAVDEVAIYSTALTANEIRSHYENGVSASPAQPYNQLVQTAAPILYWRLNEATIPPPPAATNLGSLGASANGAYLAGATGGATGAVQGDSDTAAIFNGTTAKIDVPHHPALNPTNVFTVELWARVTGGTGHRSPLTSRDEPPPSGYIFYATPDNNWEFWTGTGNTGAPWHTSPGSPVIDNQWSHLVGVFDNGVKRFYVDGVLTSAGNAGYVPNPQRPLRFGSGRTETAGEYFFNGEVDEVAFYGSVLPDDRILAHFREASGQSPTPVAPFVVSEPQGQTLYINQSFTLRVGATGSLPLVYQWKLNGTPISGATNATYTVPSASVADSGNYSVDVSNEAGPTTSLDATVNVQDISIPEFTVQPQPVTVYPGGTVRLSALATGSDTMNYQWRFNGTDLPNQTNASLVLPNVQVANQGDYTVRATNPAGSTISSTARLTIQTLPPNSYASVIMADQPVGYWRLNESTGEVAKDYAGGYNGAYLNGVTLGQPGALAGDTDNAAGFAQDAMTKVDVPYAAELNPTNYTVEAWVKSTGGTGHRSPLTSRADSPQRGYIFYATPANTWEFWTGAGTGWDIIAGPVVQEGQWTHLAATFDGATKQFFVNGALMGSSTNAMQLNQVSPLRIGAGATEGDGNFFFQGDIDEVAVFDRALSPERIQAHFGAGLGSTTPPTFSIQPQTQAVLQGRSVTFNAAASGSLPLRYQWQFKGVDLVGETNASLTIANAQVVNEGTYRVVASNLAGTLPSEEATLSVITIGTTPYRDLVIADAPVGYWRLDEEPGATTATDIAGGRDGFYWNNVTLGVPGALVEDTNTAAGFVTDSQTKVDVDFAPELNTPNFTIECWARVTGGTAHRSPVTSRADQPQRGYIFYATPANVWEFWTGTGEQTGWDTIAGPAVVLNQWYHLAATYDGEVKRFYVNGELVGTSTAPFGPNDFGTFRIGGGQSEDPTGNFFFQGSVDEVAYYDKALSPLRILTHFAAGARPAPPMSLDISRTGTDLVITWSGGTLQETDNLAGANWTDITGTSPFTITPTANSKFYRVRQ